ncbi:putative preprotein translocase secA subunit, partial [Chlamydia psittaci 84-8471/1]|jgi:hypothetical protein
MIRI